MTPLPTLCALLGQGPKTDTAEFWNTFKTTLTEPSCWNGKLTVKGKQCMLSAIKHAINTMDKTDHIDTLIRWVEGMASNPTFCQNFSHSDSQFFSGFSHMMSTVLGQNTETERQIALVGSISKLYDASQIFRSNTGGVCAKSLCNIIKARTEPSVLISKSINVIFGLVDLAEVGDIVKEASSELFEAMKSSPFPRVKLQIIELFWRLRLPMGDVQLDGTESQFFIAVAHKIISKNAGTVHVLPFVSVASPNKSIEVSGWVDVGQDDLILCYGDIINVIPFDAIGGLDADGIEISIVLDSPVPQMSVEAGSTITIRLANEISESMLSDIFSRISRGESQTLDVADPVVQADEKEQVDVPKKVMKSSVALYVPVKTKTNKVRKDVDSLFNGTSEEVSEVESDIPPPAIEVGNISETVIEEETPSPPLPEIASPNEPPVTIIAKPSQVYEVKSGLQSQMNQVAKCLTNGLEVMTKNRLDSLDQFSSTLNRQVGAFKDDIRMTMRDKEHGSIKLLESSKARFQSNIQQFKKKEASIHQTLLGYESESKHISQRLTAIQKSIRETMQQNRVSLEEELNRLRKQIRNQNSFVNDSLDDDTF